MAILIDNTKKIIVQGITGHHGRFHAELMATYGTNIVAGVTPGKGGETVALADKKVLVFDTVKEAVEESGGADMSILFVPAAHARAAALEALQADLDIVIITEHIPVHDSLAIMTEAQKHKRIVIGPNCPGIITPGQCKVGIMPDNIFSPGSVGVLSRSGTLTYEIVQHLSVAGIGQSTVAGIGGDMITGLNFIEGLELFEKDPATEQILLVGEIGGDAEERAAEYITSHISKPVVAYLAGKTAPKGKTMGHAGAIIAHGKGTFEAKKVALEQAGVRVASFPHEVAGLLK